MLPDTQLFLRPGMIELGWGHPDSGLLPDEAMRAAAAAALAEGPAALAYGAEQGPGRLIGLLSERLGRIDGQAPPPEQLMVTGGISQALDMLCGQLSRPGDVALVELPTYHLAMRIFHDRGLRLVGVPGDDSGMRVDLLGPLLGRLRAAGERVAFLYVVASFGNPSGATLSAERRAALAELAGQAGLPVIEDEAYCELWYAGPPPAPIFRHAAPGPIIRLGSFAKVLAPGLRLGWMQAAPTVVRGCVQSGLLDSGGGVNHFTAHVVAALIGAGALDAHVAGLRAAYRARRDALLAGLAAHLPAGCRWGPTPGGFFVWVGLPEGLDAAALLPAAEAAGVSYIPGARFHADGGGAGCLRLSFSLLPPAELAEGARRLGSVLAAQARRGTIGAEPR